MTVCAGTWRVEGDGAPDVRGAGVDGGSDPKVSPVRPAGVGYFAMQSGFEKSEFLKPNE